jgi:hypothetical protein
LRAFEDPGQLRAATAKDRLAGSGVIEDLCGKGVFRLAIQLYHCPPDHIKHSLGRQRFAEKRVAVLPDDVTIHDIRRTVADSLFNRIGAQPWVVTTWSWVTPAQSYSGPTCRPCPSRKLARSCQKWGEEIEKILGTELSTQGQAL